MKQYWDIKSQHKDKILMFRLGDFFEMFYEDAEKVAPLLNIALTARNKKAGNNVPMCGLPYHSISTPIAKLLSFGYKVALCDQIEDPKLSQGIVKRAVTRVLTPGMVYDPETLNPFKAHYLCSFDSECVAFLESSTGEAFFYLLNEVKGKSDVFSFFSLLSPAEIVLGPDEMKVVGEEKAKRPYLKNFYYTEFNFNESDFKENKAILTSVEETLGELQLNKFKLLEKFSYKPKAVRSLVAYLLSTQGEEALRNLTSFEKRRLQRNMILSQKVFSHLEVFETSQREVKGSLFFAVNRTKTSGGARLLKNWLSFPLTEKSLIEERLNEVEYWFKRPQKLKSLRVEFSKIFDIERRIGKLIHPQCGVRDVIALKNSLEKGFFISKRSLSAESDSFPSPFSLAFRSSHSGEASFRVIQDILKEIELTLSENLSSNLKQEKEGMIKKGFDSNLDDLITLSEDSQKLLLDLECREREATKIPSLKIGYNHIFGYYIEVTHKHKDKIPASYQRRQTLRGAERYVTQELQSLESEILSAQLKRKELEAQIFESLRLKLVNLIPELKLLARHWSELDVLISFALLAMESNYRRPFFLSQDSFENSSQDLTQNVLQGSSQRSSHDRSQNSRESSLQETYLKFVDNRHPVLEQKIEREFVSNTIQLNAGECLLLTGPNMAGKSTLMRQVALTVLLSQIGSFVPAGSAHLPLFENIFTRVGAHDNLSEGLSTFMMEMKETVDILKGSHQRSLVLLDEIGRGTSTYDGLSLAQAILEFLVQYKKPYILFATHYHELTRLSERFPQIRNYHMEIVEREVEEKRAGDRGGDRDRERHAGNYDASDDNKGEISFLYRLAPGSSGKSYGVHVAKLAGFPPSVIHRAQTLLKSHEIHANSRFLSKSSIEPP